MRILVRLACCVVLLLCSSQAIASTAKTVAWEKRLNKGYHELSIGNVERAAELFGKEVSKHPEAGAPRCALGLAYKKLGKIVEARSQFARSIEVDPGYADAYYELGAVLQSEKEYGRAANTFEKYLQLQPLSNRRASVEERIRHCRQCL